MPSARTPVRGLFETHLTVADVSRSTEFYRDVVGLPLALDLPERNAAFLWIGERGRAMLGLWGVGSAVNTMQLHIAFDVALDDLLQAPEGSAAWESRPSPSSGRRHRSPTCWHGCRPPRCTSAIPTGTCSSTCRCSTSRRDPMPESCRTRPGPDRRSHDDTWAKCVLHLAGLSR